MSKPHEKFTQIGLTGGIASGKSSVAAHFRNRGLRVVDLDALGKEITDADSETKRFLSEWDATLVQGGKTDRRRLREVAFAQPELLRELEKRLHPKILSRFESLCQIAREAGEKAVICEAALLVESGYHRRLDRLVVVTAPLAARLHRLQERDGVPESLAHQIIAAQLPDEERLRHAHHVIANTGGLRDLVAGVERLLEQWRTEGIWTPPRSSGGTKRTF